MNASYYIDPLKYSFRDFDKETGRQLACSIIIVASIVGAISMGAGTVAVATYDVGSIEEPRVIYPQPATEWPPLTLDETHDAPEHPITMRQAQDAFDVLDEPVPRHRRRHYRRRG